MSNYPPIDPPLTIDENYDIHKVDLLISIGFKQSYPGSRFFSKIKEKQHYGTEIIEARINKKDILWMIRWYPKGGDYPPYDHKASFQDVFDTLTPEQQNVAIWNLDLLR